MYIEIADGLSVNCEEIEAVARDTELTSIVYVGGHEFRSTFPYQVLLQLIGRKEEPDDMEQRKMRILEQTTNYAG